MARRLLFDEIRQKAHGDIGAAYSAIGDAFGHPAYKLIIQNECDVDLWISFDGVTDHLHMNSNNYFIFDLSAYKSNNSDVYMAKGTTVYVKQDGAPTAGSVYVSLVYLI